MSNAQSVPLESFPNSIPADEKPWENENNNTSRSINQPPNSSGTQAAADIDAFISQLPDEITTRQKAKQRLRIISLVLLFFLGAAVLAGIIVGIYAGLGCFKPEYHNTRRCNKRIRYTSDAGMVEVKGSWGIYFLGLMLQVLFFVTF